MIDFSEKENDWLRKLCFVFCFYILWSFLAIYGKGIDNLPFNKHHLLHQFPKPFTSINAVRNPRSSTLNKQNQLELKCNDLNSEIVSLKRDILNALLLKEYIVSV